MTAPSQPNRGPRLVIEDGEEAAELMAAILRAESFEPIICPSTAQGINALSHDPAAVVVDWGLPGREIRALKERIPILFVTGRTDEASVACGLDSGANDFIVKPFRSVEVMPLVAAQMRSASIAAATSARPPLNAETKRLGDIEVDLLARAASRAGRTVALGQYEFNLIEYLAENAGIAISREQILEHVYGYGSGNSTERIDALVKRVRTKLGVEEQLAVDPGLRLPMGTWEQLASLAQRWQDTGE